MTSEHSTAPAAPWAIVARDLYLVAMAVFLVTIVIGILNGTDAVEFDRNAILTHVHSGTVGWLSLTIVASTFLLFRAADRRLMLTLAVARAGLRPGLLHRQLRVPRHRRHRAAGGHRVAAVLGVEHLPGRGAHPSAAGGDPRPDVVRLRRDRRASSSRWRWRSSIDILPGDTIGAHASAMTFGYLVLTAMGFIEWRLLGTRGIPTLGRVQVGALFLGGLVISVSTPGRRRADRRRCIYLLAELVAVVIFIIRIWPRRHAQLMGRCRSAAPLRRRHRSGPSSRCCCSCTSCSSFITAENPDRPGALPVNVLIASDHAVYLGVDHEHHARTAVASSFLRRTGAGVDRRTSSSGA